MIVRGEWMRVFACLLLHREREKKEIKAGHRSRRKGRSYIIIIHTLIERVDSSIGLGLGPQLERTFGGEKKK